jgi:hypothetical protein
MKYLWKPTRVAGLLALRDENETLVAALKTQGEFTMAFMLAPNIGPVQFEALPGARLALLGLFPSAKSAAEAVQNEVVLHMKFGRYPNIIRA